MIDYVIVTPVKDEEKYIELTINSVIQQTVRPTQWIIVDDGSVDNTRKIIEAYSRKHAWIKGVYRDDQGVRQPGVKHLKAFYEGYANLGSAAWQYLVKLDGDLSFDNDYFEKCFAYFKKDAKLGIGGGMIVNVIEGALVLETHPLFHVRGATKIYSRKCWDAIGGIMMFPSYDTLDEAKANMLGFKTCSFPALKVLHHRYTGMAYGMWGNAVKNGLGDYITGYHPLFMICKSIKRLPQKPFLFGSIGLLYGFLSGYIKAVAQVPDKELIAYIRQQQLRCLTFRESLWSLAGCSK